MIRTAKRSLLVDGWGLCGAVVEPARLAAIRDWLAAASLRAPEVPGLQAEFEKDPLIGGRVRKLRRLFWNDPEFWGPMLRESGLAELALSAVGRDATLVFHAGFLKSSGGGAATPFHQDCAFWRYDYPGAVSMWLALDDTDEENGCMALCPGSHVRPLLPHRLHQADWVQPGIDLAAHGLVARPMPMAAGDVLIWDRKMVHGSAANSSQRPRWGVVMVVADGGCAGFQAFDSQRQADL